jgi:hypothetical protein
MPGSLDNLVEKSTSETV